MNFKKRYLVGILCIVIQNIQATTIVKEISSWCTSVKHWITGTQEISFITEKKFNPHGTIVIENIEGSLNIKGWNLDKIALEATKEGDAVQINQITIDTHFTADHAVIKTCFTAPKIKGCVNYQLLVPHHCSVKASTKGSLKIKRIYGQIHAQTAKSGTIEIYDAMQSVIAKSSEAITIRFKTIPLNSTIILESLSKDILCYLPPSTHADLWALARSGVITSDLYICLKPQTILLNPQTWQNFKQEIRGTLGNGGSTIKINSEKGNIKLLEY